MFNNSRGSLRLERKIIQNKIKTLEEGLNRNAQNSRKYKSDLDKIANLKNNLSEIETRISLEKNHLEKLKTANLNIANSPLFANMFHSPKLKVASKPQTGELNKSFAEKQTEIADISAPKVTTEFTTLTSERLPTTTTNSDFQSFIRNTVGLSSATTGAISKTPKQLDFSKLPITSKQLTNLLSTPINTHPEASSYVPELTQIYRKPIVFEIPRDINQNNPITFW